VVDSPLRGGIPISPLGINLGINRREIKSRKRLEDVARLLIYNA